MTDVVVIGAGFAGIAAALALQEAGVTVEVVEARDRVGGKVSSTEDQLGTMVDMGGQWVTDEMTTVIGLIRRHGLTLVEPRRPDDNRIHPTGSPDRTSELFGEISAAGGRGSIGSGIRRLPERHRPGVWSMMQAVWCQDPDDVSAEFVAAMADITEIEGDELQYFVAESIHALAIRMAGDLKAPIRLGVRATAVRRRDRQATVDTTDGTIEAHHALVAIPPQVVPTIRFTPPLEAALASACGAFNAGDVTKALLRYDDPFWSGAGCVFAEPAGMYVTSMTVDSPALVVFMGGPLASYTRALAPHGRRRFVLEALADVFGESALTPLSYVEQDWPPDELGSGGYCSVIGVGGRLDAIDVLRAGSTGLTFASTELASRYPGYIEGAIRAGREAAARVISTFTERSLGGSR